MLTSTGFEVSGDGNPFHLLIFAFLGLAVAMAPITLIFALGTIVVMAGFRRAACRS